MFLPLVLIADLCAFNCIAAQQADLAFGRSQVEQIICDRPNLAEIINSESVYRQTLELRFAGKANGFRVYWDDREPTGPQPAEHMGIRAERPAMVRVSRSLSATDQCVAILFELYNFDVDREYDQLLSATPDNRKSPDDFATSCVRHEFGAFRQTQLFLTEHPLRCDDYTASPYYVGYLSADTEDFGAYMLWLGSLSGGKYNPHTYFLRAYHATLSP